MAASDITIGENYISEIDLVDSDGNSVTLASLDSLVIKVMQYGRTHESITLPNAKLTAGTTASKLKIEISSALSLLFREGRVYARAVSGDTNALYTVDGARKSLPDYHILTAYTQRPEGETTVTTVIDHYRGLYDASVNLAPSTNGSGTGGEILGGDYWIISVAGTVFGIFVNIGNQIISKINSPGQTSGNWTIIGNQS